MGGRAQAPRDTRALAGGEGQAFQEKAEKAEVNGGRGPGRSRPALVAKAAVQLGSWGPCPSRGVN